MLVSEGPATCVSSSGGARRSIAVQTARSIWRAKVRTPFVGSCMPTTRPGVRLAACSARDSPADRRPRSRSRDGHASHRRGRRGRRRAVPRRATRRARARRARARRCSRQAAQVRSFARPRTRRSPPVTASPWRIWRARAWPTSSSCSFIRRCCRCPDAPRYLLSEALRGEGARLVNQRGEPFMTRYEPAGDLAPRDRVSRAIVRESERTDAPVYLSMAHLPAAGTRERFPHIAESVPARRARHRAPIGCPSVQRRTI